MYLLLELRGNIEQCSTDKACLACPNYSNNRQTFNGLSQNYRTIFANMFSTDDFTTTEDVCCSGCRPILGVPQIFNNGDAAAVCTIECLQDQSLTQQFQPFYQRPPQQFNNPFGGGFGGGFGGNNIQFFPLG